MTKPTEQHQQQRLYQPPSTRYTTADEISWLSSMLRRHTVAYMRECYAKRFHWGGIDKTAIDDFLNKMEEKLQTLGETRGETRETRGGSTTVPQNRQPGDAPEPHQ